MNNSVIRQLLLDSNKRKSRVIGLRHDRNSKDGNFENARFIFPTGICCVANKPIAFVCDGGSHNIRMLDFAKERVTTIAGSREAKNGFQDGNSEMSLFRCPYGIAVHKSQKLILVADQNNHAIRQIDISPIHQFLQYNGKRRNANSTSRSTIDLLHSNSEDGISVLPTCKVSTICGNAGQSGFEDGIGDDAKLDHPRGVAFSQLDMNILYVCDSWNVCIRRVNILTKQVSTIAGVPERAGFKDRIGNCAQFNYITGICVDKNENLFVCDTDNHSIRQITSDNNRYSNLHSQLPPLANVSTLFGSQLKRGIRDGNKSTATLCYPSCIVYDRISNSLIFSQDHAIRQIKLGKSFSESKLRKLFLIYRILLKQCEKSISKRLLLQLISIQILQISSSNEDGENWQQQNHQMIIERQSRIIEYIKTSSNLHKTSKLILFAVICLPL